MKKMLSALAALDRGAAVALSRAHAQVLCALGPVTPLRSDGGHAAQRGREGGPHEGHGAALREGVREGVAVRERDDAQHRDRDRRRRRLEDRRTAPASRARCARTSGRSRCSASSPTTSATTWTRPGPRPAWMKDSWDGELRADAWAGCAMAKADMSPSRLQAVLLAMSTYPSPHHPEWDARRPVITEGFTRCGGRLLPPLAKEKPEQAAKIDGRKNDTVAEAAPERLQRRQGLPERARLPEQPLRGRARATALRQGHRLPRSAGVRRQRDLQRPRRSGARQHEHEGRAEAARADAGGAAGTAFDGGGAARARRTSPRAGKRARTSATSASRPRPTRPTGASPRFSPIPATRPAGVRTTRRETSAATTCARAPISAATPARRRRS